MSTMLAFSAETLTPPGSAKGRTAEIGEKSMPLSLLRMLVGALLIGFAGFAIFMTVEGLSHEMRLSLSVFAATLIAWTVMDLPETPVALAGALALVLTGAVSEQKLFDALGSDIVFLMLAAFVIGAVIEESGLAERVAFRMLSPFRTVRAVFWTTTGAIFLTAFLVPSTSARAAMRRRIAFSFLGHHGRSRCGGAPSTSASTHPISFGTAFVHFGTNGRKLLLFHGDKNVTA